jgi:WS/DGAT/MGAT family acyltransferase
MDGFYERLSALDATFLAAEDGGGTHMHIGSVALFDAGPLLREDGGLDVVRLREYVASRLHRIPRFRQRLGRIPGFGMPVWIDDAAFDLDHHVRHTALPRPGARDQLQTLAGRIMSQPLDRARPLWELWLVEGVEGGRFALVSKIHHALADGISGVDLASVLIGPRPDFEPEPGPPWTPRPAPRGSSMALGEVAHRLGLTRDLLGRWMARDASRTDPTRHGALESIAEAVGGALEGIPETPLNVAVSGRRRVAWASLDIQRARRIGEATGTKLNDVMLTVVAGAVRDLMLRRGVTVEGLGFRVMVPVSVRAADERGQLGNRVSQLLVRLPLEVEKPEHRLERVAEAMRRLKGSGQAQGGERMTEIAELFAGVLPAGVLRSIASRGSGNMVVTNVPGPAVPTYLLGARLLAAFPVVPLGPVQALNVAILSVENGLHVGFHADHDATPDLYEFVDAIERDFTALVSAVVSEPVVGSGSSATGGSEARSISETGARFASAATPAPGARSRRAAAARGARDPGR